MMFSTSLKCLCFFLFLFKCFDIASTHSYLLYPRGDFGSFNQAHCRLGGPEHAPGDDCPGPCIDESSWQFDRNAPIYELHRNQTLTAIWPRNNHRGGFVRFSLVPKSLRMNREAHKQFAFRYSCFEADKFKCELEHCGTDEWLYRTDIQIPTTFGDGDYVLSWAWFGGLTQSDSFFGDYYSCANVKLMNGPTDLTFERRFIAGNNTVYPSACRSSVDSLGICDREPCTGLKEQKLVPFLFSGGSPAPLEYYSTDSSEDGEGEGNSTALRITGLRLVNSETEAVIAEEFGRTVYVPRDMRNSMTFQAMVEGDVDSVSFYLDGVRIQTEKRAPYMAFGDVDGRLLSWEDPIVEERFDMRVVATDMNGGSDERIFWMQIEMW